eukprot:GHVP01009314.1.p1 GENE.GHVP01009314.1~~GHVP01009314.1.p1  ORF type:complete len:379 (+),score=40.63 GHVP01009314.1:37-1173(+)
MIKERPQPSGKLYFKVVDSHVGPAPTYRPPAMCSGTVDDFVLRFILRADFECPFNDYDPEDTSGFDELPAIAALHNFSIEEKDKIASSLTNLHWRLLHIIKPFYEIYKVRNWRHLHGLLTEHQIHNILWILKYFIKGCFREDKIMKMVSLLKKYQNLGTRESSWQRKVSTCSASEGCSTSRFSLYPSGQESQGFNCRAVAIADSMLGFLLGYRIEQFDGVPDFAPPLEELDCRQRSEMAKFVIRMDRKLKRIAAPNSASPFRNEELDSTFTLTQFQTHLLARTSETLLEGQLEPKLKSKLGHFVQQLRKISVGGVYNTESLMSDLLCLICSVSKKKTCFVPCGHVVACEACAERISKNVLACPICRSNVVCVQKLFFA